MTDHFEELDQLLAAAADTSSPCARVYRHHQDKPAAVRPRDFYKALKADDRLVARLKIDGVTPIDCRVRDGTLAFATDLYSDGTAPRDEFLDKVSKASEVSLRHVEESAFADETVMSHRHWVDDPDGFPGSIEGDLHRSDADAASRTNIVSDGSSVLVEAADDEAAAWLYDWLEDTVTHYREEYVNATGEHDAARQLRDVVYEEFVQDDDGSGRKVRADGGVDDLETEQVIVSASAGRYGNTTYHCNSDCRYVKRMADTLEKPLTAIEASYDPCSECVPSESQPTPTAITRTDPEGDA